MAGFCIILSSASGGLGGPRTPRLKSRSLRSLHFPPIPKQIPSIQNLNETTAGHILEGGHPRTIPPKFGCNWPTGF
jgi:hypothetical protein